MRPHPACTPEPEGGTVVLVGVGDDTYSDPGPRTPAVECAHRALEAFSTGWRFVASMGGAFAFAVALALILGVRL